MKLRFQIVLFLISAYGYSQPITPSWSDLNYADDTMKYHCMDIYLPKTINVVNPAVILVYGSAWFGNNLKGRDINTIGKSLLDNGFIVITPNHRSSKDAIFPAQINDIKAAIRFIRANARLYKIDTSFITITGCSSGGHLSALAGTSRFVNQYTVNLISMNIEGNIGKYTSFSSSVDAVVDWFGPTDFLKMDSCANQVSHDNPNSPESCLVGGLIQENADKCKLANPITYIDKDDPPFMIFHGDSDPLVPYCQSEKLYNALQNARVPSRYILVPGAKHGPGLFEDIYLKIMVDFLTMEYKNKLAGKHSDL